MQSTVKSHSTNVDHAEIAKFDQQAQHWWDSDGPLKTLHDINPVRLAYIQEKIDLTGLSVLDVGCGGGLLAEAMARAGAHVTGLDLSPELIHIATRHSQGQNLHIDYQCQDIDSFKLSHVHAFDVITCLELLEHVPDPQTMIAALASCVKPTGHLFLSTLNRTAKSFLYAIVGAEYVLQLLPRGTHHYNQFIKPSELSNWSRLNQLQVKELKGMWYQPFSRTAGLQDDLSVNYLAHLQPL